MDSQTRWNNCDIVVHNGDITKLDTDAIVNAANSGLWAGGGVCGAIHRAAGPALAEACKQVVSQSGPVSVGQAAITPGGALRARYVIHAVGPVYGENTAKAPELLASAYVNSLRLARENDLRSIAFPCISTGIFGYPPDQACRVVLGAVRGDLEKHGALEKVVFCVFGKADFDRYDQALHQDPHHDRHEAPRR
jgi:O-acetyl-ADP-ribose deacetylase (regulator of RNase III)